MFVFIGAKQAGVICLLALKAAGFFISRVIPHDDLVRKVAQELGLPVSDDMTFTNEFIVNCHGRKIIKHPFGINVHPCLYGYKGANPVQRLIRDGNTTASVGVHVMTDTVDEGQIIYEEYVDVTGLNTEVEIYNKLYPYYAIALLRALGRLGICGGGLSKGNQTFGFPKQTIEANQKT